MKAKLVGAAAALMLFGAASQASADIIEADFAGYIYGEAFY